MNITVYLGSAAGNRAVFRQAAQELGAWIGRSGHTLIYGGSDVGLMGVLADAVLAANGRVIGVEPRFFVEEEIQHLGVTEFIVTETMSERKQKMIELGDVFVAFPGGIGTLEEISEVMVLSKIQRIEQPFCFLNIDGYYEPLRELLRHMAREGFLEDDWLQSVRFVDSVADVATLII